MKTPLQRFEDSLVKDREELDWDDELDNEDEVEWPVYQEAKGG